MALAGEKMSSGVGLFTTKGRCNPFWTEFLKCKNTHSNPVKECSDFIDDYLECLHHTKEKARMIAIMREIGSKKQDELAKLCTNDNAVNK